MDIKKYIKEELSLDQKAKLYFMGLFRQGKIDRLPEDPKAAYVSMMMDKNKLKETAIELGYLNEDNMLQKIEDGVNAITGGRRKHGSVSDRGDKIRIKFSYMRGEFSDEEWGKIKTYLTQRGLEILDDSNSYEANYDREEPPEWVPTIHLKK